MSGSHVAHCVAHCRSTIKDELIPRAVAWYTGAAVQGDDDSEEDDDCIEEGDEEEEGDDEDEVRTCQSYLERVRYQYTSQSTRT